MKKLVKESLRDFWEYGKVKDKYKDEVIDLINRLSLINKNVHLFDGGLKIGNIEINTEKNILN